MVALVTIDNGEDYTQADLLRPRRARVARAAAARAGGAATGRARPDRQAVRLRGRRRHRRVPGAIARDARSRGSRAGHELFGRIRALPFPTVAAVNGACARRRRRDRAPLRRAHDRDAPCGTSPARRCFLGIVPAWGGTQLVPRLVGAETAVKFVVANPMRQNRMLTGAGGVRARLRRPAARARRVRRRVDRLRPVSSSRTGTDTGTVTGTDTLRRK